MNYRIYEDLENGVFLFQEHLFKEWGVEDNPKAVQCFNIAWNLGHSEGYPEIAHYFSEIVELIKNK